MSRAVFSKLRARDVGQQARALRDARAHVHDREQMRFRFEVKRKIGAAAQRFAAFTRAVVAQQDFLVARHGISPFPQKRGLS